MDHKYIQFQYFSDLHLEFFNSVEQINKLDIKPMAPYLIMAGDIGNICGKYHNMYELFLTHVSKLFVNIFIITGNHEYYHLCGTKISDTNKWFEHIESKIGEIIEHLPNVIFLQNNLHIIPNTDICVYGTTLWSDIDKDMKHVINKQINDYRSIPQFNVNKSCDLFQSHVQQLTDSLLQNKDKRFIVVSHHLPSYKLIHKKYQYCELNSAFASSVDTAENSQIVAWVCGHTHMPMEMDKFHINPIGYPGENINVNYNKVFEVPI